MVGKATAEGTVPVIVGLRSVTLPDGVLDEAARASQRERLTALREAVETALAATPHRILREYETIPFLALEASPAALAVLRTSPVVASIREDHDNSPTLQESASIVEAPSVWPRTKASGWKVAVLDTGVDNLHPFLANRVISEACFASDESCFSGQDSGHGPGASLPCAPADCDHGMHVAGIVAGFKDASLSGVAPLADIVSIRVFKDDVKASDSDILKGLEHVYALRTVNHFAIASVNMSLGSGAYTSRGRVRRGVRRLQAGDRQPHRAGRVDGGLVGERRADRCHRGAGLPLERDQRGQHDQACNARRSRSRDGQHHVELGCLPRSSGPGDGDPLVCSRRQDGVEDGHLHGRAPRGGSHRAPEVARSSCSQDYFLSILRATGQPITDPRNSVTTMRWTSTTSPSH